MLWSLTLLALLASTQGRVVNISNTWVLPEEGFPVFYRYFRDRISWYEADAVCQFHHANLVTVDTTAQYDAVRAYLKELDITSAVWVGLIRSNPDGDFTWTDYRGLSSDGYWSSAPDARSAPLCAAADPAADYRWEARACGGPMVASFICELPVPQWASGSEGCMVRELPALTILYLPESAAVQLTADCGLAGVKRIQCTGNVKREELLKDLSCGEGITTEITTDVITTEINTEFSEVNTDENITTESEEVTFEQTLVRITPIPYQLRPIIKEESIVHRIPLDKDINMMQENNLESNDIPKYGEENNFLSEEESNKLEDEKHMAHKQLHNDLARLGNIGNFETIFSQSSDHFVPPLVMAKAKISDDMTVLSLEEKHAQQIAEQHTHKGYGQLYPKPISHESETVTVELRTVTTPLPSTSTSKEVLNKDVKITKHGSSKKYNEKYSDFKSKSVKLDKSSKYIEKIITPPKVEGTTQGIDTTTVPLAKNKSQFVTSDDHIIDLTIILKEPGVENKNINLSKELYTSIPKKLIYEDNKTKKDTQDTITKSSTPTQTEPLPDMKHEIIEITIPNQSKSTPTIFEVTTKMPVTDNMVVNKSLEVTQINRITEGITTKQPDLTTDVVNPKKIEESFVTTQIEITTPVQNATDIAKKSPITSTKTMENEISTTESTITTSSEKNTPSTVTVTTEIIKTDNKTTPAPLIDLTTLTYTHNSSVGAFNTVTIAENHEIGHEEILDMEEIHDDELHSSESDEDFQSPLLSAANEPLHRPVRSRRPQQTPNRIKKFNPFRMLG